MGERERERERERELEREVEREKEYERERVREIEREEEREREIERESERERERAVHREIEETARIELSASVDRLVTAQAQADILRQQLLQVSTYTCFVSSFPQISSVLTVIIVNASLTFLFFTSVYISLPYPFYVLFFIFHFYCGRFKLIQIWK